MKRLPRTLLITGAILLSALVIAFFSVGIRVPLSPFKSQIEQAAGNFIQRQVTIHGGLYLTLSPTPGIEIQDIAISSPDGWPGTKRLLTAHSGRGRLDLISLFSGSIEVLYFGLSGMKLNLETLEDHRTNFHFEMKGEPPENEKADSPGSSLTVASIDELHLGNIAIVYHDQLSGNTYDFSIAEAYGTARKGEDLKFTLAGQLVGHPLNLEFSGDEISSLATLDDSWSLGSGTLTFAGASVSLKGNVGREPDSMSGHLNLVMEGDGLGRLGEPFGISLPDLGTFQAGARLSVSPASFQATEITLDSPAVKLSSDLLLWLHGDRPTLMGQVAIERMDLGLITMEQATASPSPSAMEKEPAGTFFDMLSQELPLDVLQLADTDLHVKGSDIQLGSVALDEISGIVSLVNGDLVLPGSADILGIGVNTVTEIAYGPDSSTMSLEGSVRDANAATFLEALAPNTDLTVMLGSLDYDLASSGRTLLEMVENVSADIRIHEMSAMAADGSPLFAGKALSISRSDGDTWKITGNGQLLDRPFSTTTLVGKLGEGQDKLDQGVQIHVEACDSEIELALLSAKGSESAILDVVLQGSNFCGILEPAEQFLGGSSNVTVAGRGELSAKRWEIHFDSLKFNTLAGSASLSIHSAESGTPFMTADLHIPRLDVDKLMSAETVRGNAKSDDSGADPDEQSAAGKTSEPGTAFIQDILAILTKELPSLTFLNVADADLVLQLDELIVNGGSVSNVNTAVHLRNGEIVNSPFSADLGVTGVNGSISLDAASDKPLLSLNLSATDANLSDILSSLGLSQSPDVQADSITGSITLTGTSLLEMVKTSTQEIAIENGVWAIATPVGAPPIQVKVDRAAFMNQGDKPIAINLAGSFKDEPFSLDITEDGLLAGNTDRPVDMSINAILGDLNLQFQGQVKRNTDSLPTIHLDTRVSGSRLDKLNRLVGYDLPPIGPYELHGAMHTEKNMIRLDQLRAEVGSSVLAGKADLILKTDAQGTFNAPAILDVALTAHSLQLDDFHIRELISASGQGKGGEQAAEEAQSEGQPQESDESAVVTEQSRVEPETGSYASLLGPELSEVVQVELEVQVSEVLSGNDRLGRGHLRAHNRSGRNTIESMRIEVPGGSIELDGYFQQTADSSEAGFRLNMDRFDYGILLRRIVPESEIDGLMNVRVDLTAAAADPPSLKKHVNGKVRMGVIPEHMESGIIDLWAVNILTAALPKIMEGSESEINCLAGDFTLDDGMITPEVFLLDTSRMRVQGEGSVNLRDDSIAFHMKPIPKSPQFFSLSTPVNISGTIGDFHVGVSAGNVIGTVFKFVSSVVTVPLQKIFTEDMAADGAEACSAAMAWAAE